MNGTERQALQEKAFIREVSEDVNNEKIVNFLKKYKNYIVGVIAVILFITISINLYVSYKKNISLKQAREFEKIISNVAVSNSGKILELNKFIDKAKFGYKDVASFYVYALYMEDNKKDEAKETLKKLIKTTSDKSFKNLAIIKFGAMSNLSEDDVKTAKKMLSDISKGQAFYTTSKIVLSSILINEKNYMEAEKILVKLSQDKKQPESVKNEVQNMLHFIKASK